jgi:hypothetical protein
MDRGHGGSSARKVQICRSTVASSFQDTGVQRSCGRSEAQPSFSLLWVAAIPVASGKAGVMELVHRGWSTNKRESES